MSRLICKGSHFFSASESVVLKTIFVALLCDRSNSSRFSFSQCCAPCNIAITHQPLKQETDKPYWLRQQLGCFQFFRGHRFFWKSAQYIAYQLAL